MFRVATHWSVGKALIFNVTQRLSILLVFSFKKVFSLSVSNRKFFVADSMILLVSKARKVIHIQQKLKFKICDVQQWSIDCFFKIGFTAAKHINNCYSKSATELLPSDIKALGKCFSEYVYYTVNNSAALTIEFSWNKSNWYGLCCCQL